MKPIRRRLFALLAAAFLVAGAAPAWPQTTTPTVAETQSFTLTVPAPPSARAPSRTSGSVALPNRLLTEPTAGPLPRRLAYTGSNPLPIIAGGLAIVVLSLLTRRWTRARLQARAGG